MTVNGARVVGRDITASNGVMHITHRLLYPMAELTILDHLATCDAFTGDVFYG
jgi:hypothetical protein